MKQTLPKFSAVWLASAILFPTALIAQNNETTHELSKPAQKGILANAELSADGNIRMTYKMKVDKKSDQVNYEDYVFDKNLKFIGVEKTKEDKQTQPDQKVTLIKAFVGGSNSFNVMSMSLNLQQEVWERNWNFDKQKYQWGSRISKEVVKPKNNDSKYRGFAAYGNDDDGSVLILASYDSGDDDQFVCLHVDKGLNMTETKLPLQGKYSLVYCGTLKSGNIFAVFAPNEGMSDTKKYYFIECSADSKVAKSNEFTSPSPNMLIMDYSEANGDLYFIAGSDKSNEAYNKVFTSYAPIDNPGYSTSNNRQMDKYEKRAMETEFTNLHLLRFSDGKLAFASTEPVKDFKTKMVTPPSQKKGQPYTGKKIVIENLFVAPSGDVLVAGQLSDKKVVNGGNSYEFRYYDYVCMQFDNQGKLVAQYAVNKLLDDSKNEVFSAIQNFIPSADGKSVYWEILEVQAAKYYASVAAAYSGNYSLSSHYFPRIANITLSNHSVSNFTELGEKGKYLVYHSITSLTDKDNNRFYIGHDEDYKNIWLGKYTFR
ncbi:MAG TPA: hypothetical protein PLO82_09015 [Bacteroidia bacterium]|nr:hypothetical protein [Bacteroidia bacterium]